MALEIKRSLEKSLPSSVKVAVGKMSSEMQSVFEDEFKKKKKGAFGMFLLALIFPIHFFILGKSGLGLAYWFTGAGLGIWWFLELFLVWGRVKSYNEEQAKITMRDIKIMHS